jgi:ABC-type lipoprotein release transport system permease subunit
VLGSMILLRGFDLRTEKLVAEKQAALKEQMRKMEDEYRKITKRMGFNVIILPQDQNIADFYADNYADKFMPEEYARKIADAKDVMTIRHVLPMLQQKIEWPERQRRILLIGVQGQITRAFRADGEPLVKPVAPGTVALGYELHRGQGLKVGDGIAVLGRAMKVSALNPERGSVDDITLWMDLAEAQEMLDRKGRVSCIVALECECAWADLPKIRAEIARILPGTQVIELAGKAIARAEARREAEKNARLAIVREKQGRLDLRGQREQMLGVLVPLVVAGCAVWIGLLAWINVRERRTEVGVLRALGYGTAPILDVFLTKAAAIGLAGALLGVALSMALGPRLLGFPAVAAGAQSPPPLDPAAALAALLAAPVAAMAASWIPALLAAGEDPAVVLREE